MKRMNRVLTVIIACLIIYNCEGQNKIHTAVFDDQWKFKQGDDTAWAQPLFNDEDWKTVSSKKALEQQGFNQFSGFGWYRRQIVIPDSLKKGIQIDDKLDRKIQITNYINRIKS